MDQKGTTIKEIARVIDVCIREMSVLEKCLSWRDVCIREMSVLERCLY